MRHAESNHAFESSKYAAPGVGLDHLIYSGGIKVL